MISILSNAMQGHITFVRDRLIAFIDSQS